MEYHEEKRGGVSLASVGSTPYSEKVKYYILSSLFKIGLVAMQKLNSDLEGVKFFSAKAQ